jgi:hypothetical protein
MVPILPTPIVAAGRLPLLCPDEAGQRGRPMALVCPGVPVAITSDRASARRLATKSAKVSPRWIAFFSGNSATGVYKGFPAFEDGTNPRAWLFDDLAQNVVNNYRKAARRPVEKLACDFGDPVAVSLPQPQRLVAFRAGVEGFTNREIVDVPLGYRDVSSASWRRAMRNLLVEFAIKKAYLRDRSDLLEATAA